MAEEPERKRPRLATDSENNNLSNRASVSTLEQGDSLGQGDKDLSSSLTRSISPPAIKRVGRNAKTTDQGNVLEESIASQDPSPMIYNISEHQNIKSPIQLTRIVKLSSANNVDTVSLRDILGDPLIKECWAFNYLFDVDFLL